MCVSQKEVKVDGVSYDPMRFWSKDARKEGTDGVPFDSDKHRGEFSSRCLAYIYVRKGQSAPPAQLSGKDFSVKAMTKLGREWMKAQRFVDGVTADVADETTDEGAGTGKEKKGDAIWVLAAKIAKEMLE